MAQHEFGIMERTPVHEEKYIDYEPWHYAYISVDDDLLSPLYSKLAGIDFFWNSIDQPEKGLAAWGITLIPPESMGKMIGIIEKIPTLCHLKQLLSEAKARNKYVIHFGI